LLVREDGKLTREFIAAIAFLAALVGTLGSLFLAYDYLDDPGSGHGNPLRLLLRIGVPIVAGMLPGVLVLVLFSTLQINNFEFIDVVIHVIALGALAGIASAWFIGDPEDSHARAIRLARLPARRRIFFHVRAMLGRATVGLILGSASGFLVAVALHTNIDNALTTAGSTGPITMVLFGVWPLIGWTPTLDKTWANSSLPQNGEDQAYVLLPGIATLSLYVGLINGLFNSRAPQNIVSCINANAVCDNLFTPSAILGIGGTASIHGAVFLVGGIAASLVWFQVERALVYLWNHLFARSFVYAKVFGVVLTTAGAGFSAVAVYVFMSEASPTTFSNNQLFLVVLIQVIGVSAILGFLVPIQPLQQTLKSRAPFSRYDAAMMTCFTLCVLLPYVTLTNLGDLFSTLLNFPHVLGPHTTPPIQFQRIVFYSEAAVLLGIPVAIGVGGLTRSVYLWAKNFPHKALGAVGIGLLLTAFILQLAQAFFGLATP
jgi:hypothetical protein